jgi:prepilin-type N-terminal cleavage/methylation domain-containing protein
MRTRSGGFTLIEILMALMVLAIGLASVLAVFLAGVRASKDVVEESAAAVSAKAVLTRILSEEKWSKAKNRLVRPFIEQIMERYGDGHVWLWDEEIASAEDETKAWPVAGPGSQYCWRCRASRFRPDPNDPLQDDTTKKLIEGRVSAVQEGNPDSDELWRLIIEIYRGQRQDPNDGTMDATIVEPIMTFRTYICTGHR